MNKFRNSQNARLLAGLFYEQTLADKSAVVYTLKDHEHQGYPSLYEKYMTVADPTEYRFATEWLDGYEHWEMLCNAAWFQPYLERWRKELALKIKSQALANIIIESNSKSANSYQASKFLVTEAFVEKSQKGRPSKAAIKQEAKKIADDHFRIKQDFQRILPQLTQKEIN
jgi:hypothetical protein